MRFVMPPFSDPDTDSKAARRATAQKEQAVREAFREHNERIRPLLPPAVQELQATDLHDGLWQSLRIDAVQKTLQMNFLCGDLTQGYFDLHVTYTGIVLSPVETSLLCLLAHEETAEIDHDEIDLGAKGDPPFVHRLSWHTGIVTGRGQGIWYSLGPEIELRFSNLTLEKNERSDRKPSRPDDLVTIVRQTGS